MSEDVAVDYSYEYNRELFKRYSSALISGVLPNAMGGSIDELIDWSMKTAHKMVAAYNKALGAD